MILIIDNYDSFTWNLVHLVARAVGGDLRVVRNDDITVHDIDALRPEGILISPGPGRPADAGITEEVIRVLGETTPILGVCLGHQAIGEVYGGRIGYAPVLMHGKTSTISHLGSGLFEGVPQGFTATRYHSLVVDRNSVPDVLEITAETEDGTVMGLRHRTHPVEGIQFHPESLLTAEGHRLIDNWTARAGRMAHA
ncbi:MAG: anthranilate/aminodeoxychorismate synthase component II [Bacteroidetes bacterium CG12_big_fil_rev_8_21_14_0_65_60_17]|nr:MAG: anthranilate/aminodeoxychorismate synthase component II [Bacteroidetes bacterium CG12_big_fil_rev_8_21_14_0_65_60_17]